MAAAGKTGARSVLRDRSNSSQGTSRAELRAAFDAVCYAEMIGNLRGRFCEQIRSRPIRLNVRGVAFSPKFTKTLFVRFKSSPALRKLVADLGRATNGSGTAPTDPHLSLLYKKISPRVKKELAAVIKLPFRTVRFDSIAAVRLTLPVRTGRNVEKWKIVAKKSLRQ